MLKANYDPRLASGAVAAGGTLGSLIPPSLLFVIYAIFRYLQLVQVSDVTGAPEEVVLTDRPLQIAIVLWGLIVMAVFYLS